MSQLILDTTDPAVNEVVSQWQEGGTYKIELIITQGPSKGALVPFTVDEITDYGDPVAEAPEESPESPDEEEGESMGGNRAQIEKVPVSGPYQKGKG